MGGGLGIGPLTYAACDGRRDPANRGSCDRWTQCAPRAALARGGGERQLPVRVVRFVDNVYDYMHAADVFVTKPGGLSTAEALAARKPIVLLKPLPGQEERNVRVLTEWGVAIRARTTGRVAERTDGDINGFFAPRANGSSSRATWAPGCSADAASLVFRLPCAPKEVPA